jgi:hypothetical protein
MTGISGPGQKMHPNLAHKFYERAKAMPFCLLLTLVLSFLVNNVLLRDVNDCLQVVVVVTI